MFECRQLTVPLTKCRLQFLTVHVTLARLPLSLTWQCYSSSCVHACYLLQYSLASAWIVFYSIWYQNMYIIVFLYYNKKTFLTPVVCRICFFSTFLHNWLNANLDSVWLMLKGYRNESSRCHEVSSSSESNSTLGSFDQLPSGFRIHPAL